MSDVRIVENVVILICWYVVSPVAKFTKHRKTNLWQCYDIRKVSNSFTIKCDLQKIVRKS